MIFALLLNGCAVEDRSIRQLDVPQVDYAIRVPVKHLIWPKTSPTGFDYNSHNQFCQLLSGSRSGGIKLQTLFMNGEIGYRVVELQPSGIVIDGTVIQSLMQGNIPAGQVKNDGLTLPVLYDYVRKRFTDLSFITSDCGASNSLMMGIVLHPNIPFSTLRTVLASVLQTGFRSFAFLVSARETGQWQSSDNGNHAAIELHPERLLGSLDSRQGLKSALDPISAESLKSWGLGCATVTVNPAAVGGQLLPLLSSLNQMGAVPSLSAPSIERSPNSELSSLTSNVIELSMSGEVSVIYVDMADQLFRGLKGETLIGDCARPNMRSEELGGSETGNADLRPIPGAGLEPTEQAFDLESMFPELMPSP